MVTIHFLKKFSKLPLGKNGKALFIVEVHLAAQASFQALHLNNLKQITLIEPVGYL